MVMITRDDVALLLDENAGCELTPERAANVIETAVSTVENYAPLAPFSCKAEAAARFAGYLLDAARNTNIMRGVEKEVFETSGFSTKRVNMEYVTNHGPAFRSSGAAALLSTWKVRRAGRVD